MEIARIATLALVASCALAPRAVAQDSCPNRGQLDTPY